MCVQVVAERMHTRRVSINSLHRPHRMTSGADAPVTQRMKTPIDVPHSALVELLKVSGRRRCMVGRGSAPLHARATHMQARPPPPTAARRFRTTEASCNSTRTMWSTSCGWQMPWWCVSPCCCWFRSHIHALHRTCFTPVPDPCLTTS